MHSARKFTSLRGSFDVPTILRPSFLGVLPTRQPKASPSPTRAWQAEIDGQLTVVVANTRSEARSAMAKKLQLKRLPPGTKVALVTRPTDGPTAA